MDYIVLDMEWNQPWPGSPSSKKPAGSAIRGEIIQVGAVRVLEDGTVADEFQVMVRPKVYRHLNRRVSKLTGIKETRLREEGIRNQVSLIAGGSIRSAADVVKAVALGADACYIGTAALIAMGCHLCRTCQSGRCAWGIATQRPELVKRLDPDEGAERLINLMTAWKREIMEMMGGMGINSIEALRGNRLMLRAVGLTEKELSILGVAHAGE